MKLHFLIAGLVGMLLFQDGEWVAPDSANAQKNPYKVDSVFVAKGKRLFHHLCSNCHGKEGRGDGPIADMVKPTPTNLRSEKVQKQTDGAIYWKLSEGRGEMLAYKTMLSDEQRWQLVTYLRTFK